MLTRTRTTTLVRVLAIGAVTATPAAAHAQGRWISYASGFAGGSAIPAFGVQLADPATATSIDLQGRKLDNAVAWGGTFGGWRTTAGSRLLWGVRGEVSHQNADADQQLLPATGTLFGQPYDGPVPAPAADGSATLFTGTVLVGWRLGGDATSALGRVTPYAGVGGGLQRVSATFTGQGEASDVAGALQVIGGVAVALSHRVSTFVEYRYHRSDQHLVLGSQTIDYSVRPSHVVAGFTLKLF
jgi:opacity protein-like surface antigen